MRGFGVSEDRVEPLLSGPVVVKRGIDEATAGVFLNVLKGAGVNAEARPHGEPAASVPAPAPSLPPASSPRPTRGPPDSSAAWAAAEPETVRPQDPGPPRPRRSIPPFSPPAAKVPDPTPQLTEDLTSGDPFAEPSHPTAQHVPNAPPASSPPRGRPGSITAPTAPSRAAPAAHADSARPPTPFGESRSSAMPSPGFASSTGGRAAPTSGIPDLLGLPPGAAPLRPPRRAARPGPGASCATVE